MHALGWECAVGRSMSEVGGSRRDRLHLVGSAGSSGRPVIRAWSL